MTITSRPRPVWAYVGNEVVYILKSTPKEDNFGESYPEYGKKYTIREVYKATFLNGATRYAIRLKEIHNPVIYTTEGHLERGFDCDAFKPLVKRTQEHDMEIFTPILINSKDYKVLEVN